MKLGLVVLGCALAGPALAQYKIVHPDGSVSYADRPPPSSTAGRITSLGSRGVAPPGSAQDGSWPIELRQTAARYPVTLYTGQSCPSCDDARKSLLLRGIPFTERQVLIEDDAAALVRVSGGRTLPTLTVGAEPFRGWNPMEWASLLDAAGYPKESRLPRGWQPAPAVPLAPRAAASAASAPAPGAASAPGAARG